MRRRDIAEASTSSAGDREPLDAWRGALPGRQQTYNLNRRVGYRSRVALSRRIDRDPTKIDVRTVKLAFDVAARLGTQSMAIAFLSKDGAPVILEISYTFGSWAVRDCPGHWLRPASPDQPSVEWVDGSMRPEDAIFEDFTNGW